MHSKHFTHLPSSRVKISGWAFVYDILEQRAVVNGAGRSEAPNILSQDSGERRMCKNVSLFPDIRKVGFVLFFLLIWGSL